MSEFNYETHANYRSLIQNGNDFLEAAWRCSGRDGNGVINFISDKKLITLPAATVVTASFAIEMYLKGLILFEGNNYPTDKKGHDICHLFHLLSPSTQSVINNYCSGKGNKRPTFESFAEKHSKDFVTVRYYVTRPGWQGMDPLTVLMYTFNLSQAIKLII